MDKYEILCYGDSNTFGIISRWSETEPLRRFDRDTRWPCVLQKLLGDDCFVTEAGLGGRTTIYDPPAGEHLNGEKLLLPTLLSTRPLDLVIIKLGINDLHLAEPLPTDDLGKGITRLIQIVKQHPECGRDYCVPDILIVGPVSMRCADNNGRTEVYDRFFGQYGERQSHMLSPLYRDIAKEQGCYFLDAGKYAEAAPADGLHLTAESHIKLAVAIAGKVEEIRQRKL